MKKSIDQKNTITSILFAVFGGFYSLLADLSSILPFTHNLSLTAQIILRISISLTVAFVIYFVSYILSNYRQFVFHHIGFIDIFDKWFPTEIEKRIEYSRNTFKKLVTDENFPIKICSVSGEWDICRPFTEKELRDIFKLSKCEIRVLLAHPLSDGLRRRCSEEKNQDLQLMMNRIVHNTEYLLGIGGIKCQVRWYNSSSLFHIVSNLNIMHFSPFADGIPGHDTKKVYC